MIVQRRFAQRNQRWGVGAISPEAQAAVAALLPGALIVQTIAPTTTVLDISGRTYTTGGEHAIVLPDGTRISAEGFQRMLETSDPQAIAGGLQSMLIAAATAAGADLPHAVMATRAQMPPETLRPLELLATTPGYIWPSGYVAPTPAQVATGQAREGMVHQPRLTLTNLSRPGQTAALVVGDQWQLAITGAPPNATVTGTARHSDKPASTTDFGKTNAAGNWQLGGAMGAEHIGAWVESWTVGGLALPTLYFLVSATPAVTPPSPPRVTAPPAEEPKVTSIPITVPPEIREILAAIPTWGWLAGAGVAVLLLTRGGRA